MLPLWYVVFPSPAVPQYRMDFVGTREYSDDDIIFLLWCALLWERANNG